MRGFMHRRGALKAAAVAACLLAATLGTAAWRWTHAPRVWGPGEVPVAFWSWRADAPTQEEVARAFEETGARALFLRAGQLDYEGGRVGRIRAAGGKLPSRVELHLVYNGTRSLLGEFERIGEAKLAAAFLETFRGDVERARRDGASVAGLQLDLDVPTRLLARYGRVLREVREGLPREVKLSVTGLTTWMDSEELGGALEAVDFWSPQFYGAEIPATLERVVPIASPRAVEREVKRARALGKPFYAGLAAYGHALLYSSKGKLLSLHGDLDPARVAAARSLELVERRAFEARGAVDEGAVDSPHASEWRYVFRAREDASVEGVAVRAGEVFVLDLPSSEALRAGVRGVRRSAGEKLLGICLFRLPTRGDQTTLGLGQLAAALRDEESGVRARLRVEAVGEEGRARASSESVNQLFVTATNEGAAGALFGDEALVLTLRVPRGSLRGVSRLEGFDAVETLCAPVGVTEVEGRAGGAGGLRPCAPARASAVRLKARGWPGGAGAGVGLSFEGDPPEGLAATVAVRADDGRVWEQTERLSWKKADGR
ncbi:MAG TPA: DUF3142 domain-containing protein [Pyrinomonadaceae bacterium]|nr:DUF3142 domain-containing protein [Pyrinomonadaceae bacterium]